MIASQAPTARVRATAFEIRIGGVVGCWCSYLVDAPLRLSPIRTDERHRSLAVFSDPLENGWLVNASSNGITRLRRTTSIVNSRSTATSSERQRRVHRTEGWRPRAEDTKAVVSQELPSCRGN